MIADVIISSLTKKLGTSKFELLNEMKLSGLTQDAQNKIHDKANQLTSASQQFNTSLEA